MATRGTVSVIGVGNMGGAMAANLLQRGWTVRVDDIDAAKVENLKPFGALALSGSAQAAIDSIATVVCVVDAAQTETVLFGARSLAQTLKPGHVVLLCPTLAPEAVESFASRMAAHGLVVLDAPMSGGPARARDGSMTLMVSGDAAARGRLAPLLGDLAGQVFHIGVRPGDAARTKLVNNLLAAINLVGAAEVTALAERLGLDLAMTWKVIAQSSGQSWIGSDRMQRAIQGDFSPRAHLSLLQKDTGLAVDCAEQAGFAGPLGAVTRDVFARAAAAGLAGEDDSALLKFLRGTR
jgi:L-threonate 2-dehydrogenase